MIDDSDINVITVSDDEIEQARLHGEIIVTEDSGIRATFSYWNDQWYMVDIEEVE